MSTTRHTTRPLAGVTAAVLMAAAAAPIALAGWHELESNSIRLDTRDYHAVTFSASAHGTLSGSAAQSIPHGGSSAPVEALPDAGYAFVRWTSGGTPYSAANPLTVTNVTADTTLTAEFARNRYTLTYLAGPDGSLAGTTPQTVDHGENGTAVTALAATGYHFVGWSDGATANPRTDTNVTADLTVTASFAPNQYTVTFRAGARGALAGGTPDVAVTVTHGAPAPAAPAVTPEGGWSFTGWLPVLAPTITGDVETTAQYAVAGPIAPAGAFRAVVGAAGVVAGRGWWDLSSTYGVTVAGNPLALTLAHDPAGKLSGTATYTLPTATVVTMPIKGSVKGASGSITMKATLKGATPDKSVSVSLAMNLTVDTASRRLTGPLTGTVKSGGVTTPVKQNLALDIPSPMDGTWTLAFQLAQAGTAVTGTATLRLSNGVDYTLVVKGKTGANSTAVLSLAGDKSDPTAKAIKIKTTITPLEGGWARLESFSGKGYGQTLAW